MTTYRNLFEAGVRGPSLIFRARKFSCFLAALMVTCFVFIGPRQGAANEQTTGEIAAAGRLKHLTLQLAWLNQFQFAGYYAAVEKGFYRDAGFEVTLVEGSPGQSSVEEVVSGRANYGVARAELLLHRLEGKPVIALATIFQHSAAVLLAKKETGIDNPHSMIGRRVMLLEGRDAAEYIAMFRQEGVSLEQIKIIPSTYDINDLIDGKTDVFNAYITNETYFLESRGIPVSVISPRTYGIDFYGDCLFTSEQELQKYPDQVKAFREASLRGWKYAMAHPEEIVDVLLKKYAVKKSRDHLRFEANSIRKLMLPNLIQIGHMNLGRWRHMAETYVKLGMADPDYSLEGFIYHPNPIPDYTWVWWVVGVTASIGLLFTLSSVVLLSFNRGLQKEIILRKQAEEELRESEERYRSLFQNNHAVMFLIDPEAGHIVDANPAASSFYGYSVKELRTKKIFDINLLSREEVFQEMEQARKEQRNHFYFRHRLATGDVREVEVFSGPISLHGKSLLYSIIHDITDRKEAEAALRESEEQYRALFEKMPIVCFTFDREGRFLTWNRAAEQVYGYTKEDAIGASAYDLIVTSATRKATQAVIARVFAGETVIGSEWQDRNKDGAIGWRMGNTFPLVKGDGSVECGVNLNIDITKRKRAEEDLFDREELLNQILRLSPVGIGFAQNSVIKWVNEAMLNIFGYEHKDECVGKSARMLYPSDTEFERVEAAMCGQIGEGKSQPVDAKFARKDGSFFNGCIQMAPQEAAHPQKRSVVVIYDISERKKLEAQLQQTHKMEAIGTLAGGIAHDFNNILSIILGNVELAMDEVPEWYTAQENLKEVRKACLRAKDMVKQILAFSRQTDLERKPLRLSPIIRESVKLLRASIPTTIDIHQYISAESDTVSADATQINQVMINLCTNAAHAMAEKGGVLEVSLEDLKLDENSESLHLGLKPGDYVRLTVSDTGHGIEAGLMDRIFDPYFSTREVGQGTGMGLAVVHGIVKSHGGVITVDSQPGKGAAFRIFLPSVKKRVEPEPETPQAIPRGSERILFVDDEQPLVNLERQVLQRLGYDVVTRTSSFEALELFRAGPDRFDLVITDMAMPQMAGDRLAEEIMKIRPDIPVILCTGHSERINEERAMAMGIRAFVMKPIVKRNMAVTIRKVLDGK